MKLFLHMPKCGGTSVLRALEAASTVEVIKDYNSFFKIPRPERTATLKRSVDNPATMPGSSVIYGHFFPVKYLGNRPLDDFTLVTILRDPISRLLSHYNFWRSGEFPDHYLWNKMMVNKWDFFDFAFCEEMRNFYAQHFHGVGLSAFSYIGTFENLEESFRSCCRELGVDADHVSLGHDNRAMREDDPCLPQATLQKLRAFHSLDYAFYNYATKKFPQKAAA